MDSVRPDGWPSLGRVSIVEGMTPPSPKQITPPLTPPPATGNCEGDWWTVGGPWDDPNGRLERC